MKKFISFALALVLCLGLFAGCNQEPADPSTGASTVPTTLPAENPLDNAVEYLYTMYKPASKNEPTKLTTDKEVLAVVVIDGVKYSVEWTVEVTSGPAEGVTVAESSTANMVKIDVMDQPEEELYYTATATVKDEKGETKSVSFDYYTPAVKKVEINDDGKVVIYMPADGKYVTDVDYLYTSSSGNQKHELELTEDKNAAVVLTVQQNDDGTVSFVTDDNRYLFCDATNVQFVAEQGDFTKYYLEAAENGQYIKCAVANFSGKPQYIEVYSGYLTCYSMSESSNLDLYTFQLETVSTVSQSAILDAAYSLGTGETLPESYTLTGVITKIDTAWSEEYQNITVTIVCDGDTARPMMCFRLKGDGAKDLAEGDTITVTGTIKNYNGIIEFDSGCNLDKVVKAEGNEPVDPVDPPVDPVDPPVDPVDPPVSNDPAADSTLTVKEAIDLGASKAHNTYTEGKYYVSGVITEVYNTQYGNMKIKDDAGNILTIYGTYDADGTNRYDAMATQPVAGDTVTIYGVIGQYNDTPQIKNGWIVAHTANGTATPDVPAEPDKGNTGDVTLANGMKVVIYAPAYGKALSVEKTGFYNVGVDVTVDGTTLSGYGDSEIFTVTDNGDGTWSFANGGQNIGLADQYSSMDLGAVNDKWTVTSIGDGLYLITNVGRAGMCMEWYNQYSNWSTYGPSDPASDDQFQMCFYVVE